MAQTIGSLVITKESLADRVARTLRKAILLGEFSPGYHLNEARLSRQFAVSRGSLRGAIVLLEQEGLVQTPGNGRTVVVGLSRKDLHDLWGVRKTLEAMAIRVLIANQLNQDLGVLHDLIARLKVEQDHATLVWLDSEFHFQLVALAQNRTLTRLWSGMRGVISTVIEISSNSYQRREQIAGMHEDVLQAITEGRTEGAIELLSNHLDTGERRISEYLTQRDGADPA